MYTELLKLCGFDLEEIEKERSRIDRAFDIMKVNNPVDIKRAEERLKKYVWVESLGMRKIVGIWLKDMIDLVLAEEEGKKTVYTSYPPIREIAAITANATDNIVGACPEALVTIVMGLIFGKLNQYLEKAESRLLKHGLAFCSLLKARMGAIESGLIPVPTFTIPSGLICDQAPKTDEILHEMYGIQVQYIDALWDESKEEYPVVSPRHVKYLGKEMENAVKKFGEIAGIELTDERSREILRLYVKADAAWQKVLWQSFSDPMPLSRVERTFTSGMVSSCNRHGIQEGEEALTILAGEVQKRIDNGFGIAPKNSPRIWFLIANLSDPTMVKFLENDLHLVMPVGLETLPEELRYKSNYKLLWEQRADINLRIGSRRSGISYSKQIISACKEFQLDGLILQYHVPCHMYDIFPFKLKDMVQKELGMPVLLLEGDWYETRDYNLEGYRTKLEAFAETVRIFAEKMRPSRTPIRSMKSEDLKWFSLK